MRFDENTKFRGRWFFPALQTHGLVHQGIRHLPWRDTVYEAKADLGLIKGVRVERFFNAFDYIENERGAVAIPSRVLSLKIGDRVRHKRDSILGVVISIYAITFCENKITVYDVKWDGLSQPLRCRDEEGDSSKQGYQFQELDLL